MNATASEETKDTATTSEQTEVVLPPPGSCEDAMDEETPSVASQEHQAGTYTPPPASCEEVADEK
ncbi:hypothetical protein GLAREA_12799 [Glarea lozoyensis ATCC 20868]|uniref:Uncharacterized protein n=1 Tax=Glarea lozoyensis (strain ATCC 20868 / MF5171) TaxID=1116229 RepID=S3DDL0_GLAL2|nr:uncharacterized protein GLAREA_12799 [Glarea lozoyensis ATCC 20868]EPE30076.1 hypothetical protein GLAREA_12799 [Glarea lozoyensis ATCC 20868]